MATYPFPAALDAPAIATTWLTAFADALVHANVDAVASLVHEHGWFRDMLTFTWDMRSLSGHARIKSYLENTLAKAQISKVQLDTRPSFTPAVVKGGPGPELVELAFTFETPKAHGHGLVKLFPPGEGEQLPSAHLVVIMIKDWQGHEEMLYETGVPNGHTLGWADIAEQRRAEIERDPVAVIVGAGHTGLQVAARLRQMNIRALIIEQHSRVGDGWRKRYPTLFLHTPRSHHNLLYQPFPSNWPQFTSKDKLAAWFEQYAETNDLVIWTSSKIEIRPFYDQLSGRWDIVVNRNGTPVSLRPKHLLWATGLYGEKNIPVVPGLGSFKGPSFHAMDYKGGQPFSGKNVVVVGGGNTSVDICQDLHVRGASSVTLIQRSPSGMTSNKLFELLFSMIFPEGIPQEASDLKFMCTPVPLLREMGKMMVPWMNEFDKDLREGLERSGFRLTNGHDGSGQLIMSLETGGGYFIDVGCAKLIIDGKVKVKHGVEIARVTTDTVIFTDGSELKADAIIFATGFNNVRESMRPLFGDDVIDRIDDVWGIDNRDGEVRSGFKPTKQPGLWIPVGDFATVRVFSKQLALFMKAIEISLVKFDEIIQA